MTHPQRGLSKEEIEANRESGLRDMDDRYLRCREHMHPWEEKAVFVSRRWRGTTIEITEVLECPRCETQRKDVIDARTYELASRTYRHPEGYLLNQAGFTLRADVRAERFRRHRPSDLAPVELVAQEEAV